MALIDELNNLVGTSGGNTQFAGGQPPPNPLMDALRLLGGYKPGQTGPVQPQPIQPQGPISQGPKMAMMDMPNRASDASIRGSDQSLLDMIGDRLGGAIGASKAKAQGNIVTDPTDDGSDQEPDDDPDDQYEGQEANRSMIRDKAQREMDQYDRDGWEGKFDSAPTKKDLDYLEEFPTDGVINSFVKQFPTYADQNNIMLGGKGEDDSEDDYAISGEEKDALYKKRKTRIDER